MGTIHPVFMSSQSKSNGSKVPESCIQSAEFIIQANSNNGLKWQHGVDVQPNVWMHFGSGKSYNITTEENVHMKPDNSNIDFNFDQHTPVIGEGVAFINIGHDAKGYNMHFMAILATEGTGRTG